MRSDSPALVRGGQVSPSELLDEALARTAALNPQINAVIHLMEPRARAAIAAGLPEGPFRGVPFLIKDLMTAFAGEPMRLRLAGFSGTTCRPRTRNSLVATARQGS